MGWVDFLVDGGGGEVGWQAWLLHVVGAVAAAGEGENS